MTNFALACRATSSKAVGGKMMALIDDQMPIVPHHIVDDALADQALNDGHVENARRLFVRRRFGRLSRAGNPRNVDNRSIHCSCNCRRCTRTRVLTPRLAISHAATTVLPKAVVAESTPVSWASMAAAAICCRAAIRRETLPQIADRA